MTDERRDEASSGSNPRDEDDEQTVRDVNAAAARMISSENVMVARAGHRIADIARSLLLELAPDDQDVLADALAYPATNGHKDHDR